MHGTVGDFQLADGVVSKIVRAAVGARQVRALVSRIVTINRRVQRPVRAVFKPGAGQACDAVVGVGDVARVGK